MWQSCCHLIHSHLPQCQRHALLDIQPLLCLFLQHIASQQRSLRNCVVLLKYFQFLLQDWKYLPTHRNPPSSDNLVDCQPFLRVGLQTSLTNK